eukprot:TRINITY_DN5010_c0_g2_i3.p3 TRINITY_DN5010_c0_g2~~TRINITY_DN5010_c0_g2_i3.p3  ORF type:complete len:154 (+),score=60.71 TRINITY_DN5010_c0_g2_i3:109-570(+)
MSNPLETNKSQNNGIPEINNNQQQIIVTDAKQNLEKCEPAKESGKENSQAKIVLNDKDTKPKPKNDYELRYLEHLKALAEKKAKETQEIEDQRKKMVESREKLKKVVLARAEKLRQLKEVNDNIESDPDVIPCLLYTSPSPRDLSTSRMPSSA